MNILTYIEKQKLERELRMDSGYVLDFSNRTFGDFFREVVGVDIYHPRYSLASGSKANRMRAFWQVATEEQLRLLFAGLLEAWDLHSNDRIPGSARQLIQGTLARMRGAPAPGIEGASQAQKNVDERTASQLHEQLIALSSMEPQARGYAFERFLGGMFAAYGLAARAPFRLVGEQIDGSFVLNSDTYLLEAKWQSAPTPAGDLHTFEGKIREKADWSRGLFVSNSGFSKEGLSAFGRGKRIVCMDGFDLSEMLTTRRPITDVLDAKVRRAAETGSPFVSVRELFA